MGQGNIISIDPGLIDRVIGGIEEINEKMNGAAVIAHLPIIWDQACHILHKFHTL